jgi:hypothetical protein
MLMPGGGRFAKEKRRRGSLAGGVSLVTNYTLINRSSDSDQADTDSLLPRQAKTRPKLGQNPG